MKKNQVKIMAVLSAMSMLMTSCDDGGAGYVVVPIWIVVIILVCFFCN